MKDHKKMADDVKHKTRLAVDLAEGVLHALNEARWRDAHIIATGVFDKMGEIRVEIENIMGGQPSE